MKLKICAAAATVAALAGCVQPPQVVTPGVHTNSVADRPSAAPVDVGIHWGWRIVGDAAVRPVQVFDLNGQTYLQMQDQRPVVLLVNGQVVPFQISPPFLVVQGTPLQMDVVRDGYRSVLERGAAEQQQAAVPAGVAQDPEPPVSRRLRRVGMGSTPTPAPVAPTAAPVAAPVANPVAPAAIPDAGAAPAPVRRTGRIERVRVE